MPASLSKLMRTSIAFRSVLETARIVSPRNCCVIINGQTGTGKEMITRKFHTHNFRADLLVPAQCLQNATAAAVREKERHPDPPKPFPEKTGEFL